MIRILARRVILACVALLPPALARAQNLLYHLPGDAPGDRFGYSAAVVGDLDGDGADDFLVGAPRSGATGTDAGRVRLVSGASGTTLNDFDGGFAGAFFGTSLAVLGDVDGDLVPDWAIGAPGAWFDEDFGFFSIVSAAGEVAIYSGATQTRIRTHVAPVANRCFGFSVAGGGDVDLDGVPDYLIGAPSEGASFDGALHVISGATGQTIRTTPGPVNIDYYFGFSCAILGDVDGDGTAEYAAGEPGYDWMGTVSCFSGASGVVTWSKSLGIVGNQFGYSLAAPGDLDGDGAPDLIASAKQFGNSFGASGWGQVYWLNGASGASFGVVTGIGASQLGRSLAILPDLDGDGVRESAAGAPSVIFPDDQQGTLPADVRIFSGGYGDLLATVPKDQANPRSFGSALAAGDVDGNGIADLVVGSCAEDDGGVKSGRVAVYTWLADPQVYCTSQANSAGCVPHVFWTGTPSLAAGTLRVKASEVLNGKSGLLYWGTAPVLTPFGGGTLCVAAPTTRTPVQSSGGNPPPSDCSGTFAFHFSTPYMNQHGLAAGTALYTQYWSRDPLLPSGFDLTDAVAFTIQP